MRKLPAYTIKCALYLLMIACSPGSEKPGRASTDQSILVFAAASLGNVMEEIRESFEQKTSCTVRINLASSGTLARQISQGAPAEVYVSANISWLAYVDSLGYLSKSIWDTIAQNRLVLIAPYDSPVPALTKVKTRDLLQILQGGRLSLGDPAHVPAGIYARQALESAGGYTRLQGQVLPAKDVRSALMIVELGEAPLGIVYQTDAQQSSKVKIVHTFPLTSHPPILYGAGLVQDSPESRQFLAYLSSEEARAIWARYGFTNK